MEPIRSAFDDWLEALHPRTCALCGAASQDGLACAQHELPRGPSGERCPICCAGLSKALAGVDRCADCRREAPGFAKLVALADYRRQSGVRDWILALKHGGRRDLARPLGWSLARLWSEVEPEASAAGALLVPVPLHPWRRLERGYDQARLLADAMATHTHARVVPALVRVRPTGVQGSVGSVSRAANVRGAFRATRRPFAARAVRAATSVWLVDDVVTSGATLRECARALRRMGAKRVSAVALARAARASDDES